MMENSLSRRFSFQAHHAGAASAADSQPDWASQLQQQQQQQQHQLPQPPRSGDSQPTAPTTATSSAHHSSERQTFVWSKINESPLSALPPPRSGAASVVVCGKLYVFGGYGGGTGRLDDFWNFDICTETWEKTTVLSEERPGCRENNGVVIADDANKSIFLFGGYDGQSWLNDLWKFDIETKRWTCLQRSSSSNDAMDGPGGHADASTTAAAASLEVNRNNSESNTNGALVSLGGDELLVTESQGPSRRFGYVSVVHEGKFIVWGGFDGSRWLNDMYVYCFSTNKWSQIHQPATPYEGGTTTTHNATVWPSVRSCPAWAKDEHFVYIQGGYDGVERKSDFFALDLTTLRWKQMNNWGNAPSPRYFHSCGIHDNKLFLYGGYSGTERLADLFVYDLETQHWSRIDSRGETPSGRSSLVLQVYESHLYIFGGYNGSTVLNDFFKFRLKPINLPPPSLVRDLSKLIQNQELSDVVFLVEGQRVYANRAILAIRSEYFRVMLCGGMRESSVAITESSSDDDGEGSDGRKPPASDEIFLPDVAYDVFLLVLEFIYTDSLQGSISLETGIQLLISSELFMLDRLKALCEDLIRRDISVHNVIDILMAAARHNAIGLKDLALEFLLRNLSDETVMEALSRLKSEPDLLLEIIRRSSRSSSASSPNQQQQQQLNQQLPQQQMAPSPPQPQQQLYHTSADGRLVLPSWNSGASSGSNGLQGGLDS